MNKLNMALIALAFALTSQFSTAAQAEVQEPIWNCALNFDIQGGGLKVFVGKFKMEGYGQISCMDIAGNTEEIPVYVRMGGRPVSLGVGFGKMRLIGIASGIGISGEPRDLIGRYAVAGIRGSLMLGAGADLALRATDRAFTLNTSVQAVSGFGANVGIDFLTIQEL